MAQSTIRKEAQIIREIYYRGTPSDDANHSLRFFAELVAQELAVMANQDALLNSNNGESAYANDQFITTFKNVPITTDDDGEMSSVMPSTPASLPNGREVAQVSINGAKCMEAVPIKNRSSFVQGLIGFPTCFVTYKVEGTKIIYKTDNPVFNPTSATIKLVGATADGDLLSSPINAPANYLAKIRANILASLIPLKQISQDNLNNAVSNPT